MYGDLRINGDGDSGRLEFKRSDGSWGTVCDDGFDNDAGDVACRQLGYKRLGSVNKYDYSNKWVSELVLCVLCSLYVAIVANIHINAVN